MEAAMGVTDIDLSLEPFKDLARDYIEQWSTVCGRFLQWEREHILKQDASPDLLKQHRDALKWLLRITRMLHASIADPDFPDRSLAGELQGRVLQLESSWGMIHEPIPEADAVDLV